jgi:hypothetical protein
MQPSQRAIQKALKTRKTESTQFNINNILFKEQLEFVNDPNPYVIAVCSRRAGKTIACAAHMIDVALKSPHMNIVYITTTIGHAKRIIWKDLLRMSAELPCKPNNVDLQVVFDNGAIIHLAGAKDAGEIEKFRGMHIKLVYIDEGQSFRPFIEDLVRDILEPALMDYNGQLRLIGTPGPITSGYFYECWVNDTWGRHKWTFFQNHHITTKSGKTHEELLARILKSRGVDTTDPGIQREFYGNWVVDTNSLLLHLDLQKSTYKNLPPDKYTYLMGIDIGHNDADAIAILAWSESSKNIFLVDEFVTAKQDITDLVNAITMLDNKYKVAKMVMDTGGLGLKIAEELRRRNQLPILAADKKRKMENVALLNQWLRLGQFKVQKDSKFAEDSFLVEIDRDRSTPERLVVKDSYHSDIIDAVLYAFRESPAYTYNPPVGKPKPGTQPWFDAEVERLEQEAEEYFKKLEEANGPYSTY